MTLFFSDAQIAVARESYDFWIKKTDHLHACALLGNEGGETGFIWKIDSDGKPYTPPGDHGEASGIFQWHASRALAIMHHTGIDVVSGDHLSMLNGAYAEMTEFWSAYKHVWSELTATTTLWSAVSVLVAKYEQSASQASDDVKRSAIALYFDHEFADATS